MRSDKYKLIWNLDPASEFRNTEVTRDWFKSWQRKAEQGDQHAKAMVSRFFKRPEFELYDVVNDPYNMVNIAGEAKYADVKAELKGKLDAWMESQGDKGLATEMACFERMLSGNKEFREWKKAKKDSSE